MNRVQFGEGACEKTRRYMDAYISNELLVETNHEMLRHLETCPACSAELETRGRLRSRLKSAVQNQPVPARTPRRSARADPPPADLARGRHWVLAARRWLRTLRRRLVRLPLATAPSRPRGPRRANQLHPESLRHRGLDFQIRTRRSHSLRRLPQVSPQPANRRRDGSQTGTGISRTAPACGTRRPPRLPHRDGSPVHLRQTVILCISPCAKATT